MKKLYHQYQSTKKLIFYGSTILFLVLLTSVVLKDVKYGLDVVAPTAQLLDTPYPAGMALEGVKTVVIDAGHGGKDPGCLGSSTKEKEIALGVSLKLGKMISEKYPDIKVVYTRKTDVFLELHERAKVANDNDADLFICVHCNSAGSVSAHGTETYVMGLHKSEENLNVAKRENEVIYLEEDHEKHYEDFNGSPDALLAITLQQSAYLKQSVKFAAKLQNQFAGIGRYDRGVKQAGFVVLYKTNMPSVLVESGFLTNAKDEAYLMEDTNQLKMAGAMLTAFEEYKEEIDAVNKSLGVAVENPVNTSEYYYSIQFATTSKKYDVNDPTQFKGLKEVDVYYISGLYRYYYAKETSYTEIQNRLKEIESKYPDAFIIAMKNGRRVNMSEAKKNLN